MMLGNVITSCVPCNLVKSGNRLDEDIESHLLSIVHDRNTRAHLHPLAQLSFSGTKWESIPGTARPTTPLSFPRPQLNVDAMNASLLLIPGYDE